MAGANFSLSVHCIWRWEKLRLLIKSCWFSERVLNSLRLEFWTYVKFKYSVVVEYGGVCDDS